MGGSFECSRALSHTLSHFILITTWWGKKPRVIMSALQMSKPRPRVAGLTFPRPRDCSSSLSPIARICKPFSRRFPRSLQLARLENMSDDWPYLSRWPFIFLSKQVVPRGATTAPPCGLELGVQEPVSSLGASHVALGSHLGIRSYPNKRRAHRPRRSREMAAGLRAVGRHCLPRNLELCLPA